MLESDTPSKAFLGVRFCLYGFDPVNEHKVRVKLIDGGGVGVGHYSQNCTHLIVDKIVYDDPACVAARNDGKTIVNGLWVDHSFDIGMPVDATSIMYRPLRDLSGIPGAKSLVVCLTGYQRQDRDDIMTMVSLMGAQFSKPLVASKVTHLICYKFEGEKYELAKKIKKIKLINHRWLEDCLREWEILSEANYSKSGYELEVMEAEAKDSDEEAKETTLKHSEQRSLNRSPHNLRAGMLSSRELVSSVEGSTWTMHKHSPNTKEVLATPGKSHQGTSVNNVSSTKLARPGDDSPNFTNMDNYLASTSKIPSLSNQMFSDISNAKKTPRKPSKASTPPNLSREESGNNSGVPQAMKIKDVSDVSSSKLQQPEERIGSCLDRSPRKGSDLCHGKDSAGMLPQKRALEASGSSSKSQKMSNAKASVKGSALNTDRWEPRSLGDQPQIDDYAVNETCRLNSSCAGNATAKLSTDLFSSKTVTPEDRQNSSDKKSPGMSFSGYRGSTFAGKPDMQNEITYEKSPQMSFKGLRESTPASRSNIGDSSQVEREPGELQNKQQDAEVPSLGDRKLQNKNSHSPSKLDVLEGGNDKSVTKSISKKLAKMTKPVSKPDMQSENAYEESPQMSFKGLRETTSASRSNIGEYGLERLQVVGEPGELQHKQQDVDVPSPNDREMQNENSLSPSNLDVLEGGNSKSVIKSVSKKLVKMTEPVNKLDMQSENAYEKSLQKSLQGLRETTSERLQVVGEPGELQNKQQDAEDPSLDERKVGNENSHSPFNLNVLEGGNGKSVTKPVTKKLPKKTLGSRPKLSNIANRKCSIYSSKIAAENHSTVSLDGENERATHKSVGEHETCPLTINLDAAKDVKEVTKCQNSATSKTQFTDDETQPPDEEDDNDPKKTVENEKSELVELTRKTDTFVEVEHVSHDSNVAQHGSPIASENRTSGTDPERAVGSKDSKFGGLKKKANKRKKTGRAMMKADPSNSKNDLVGENGSVQKNVEEKENEEENDPKKTVENEKSELVELMRKADTFVEVEHVSHYSNVAQHGSPIASENRTSGTDPERAVGSKDSEFGGLKKKSNKRKKTGRALMKADPSNSKNDLVGENGSVQKNVEEKENEEGNDPKKTVGNEKSELVELTCKGDTFVEVEHVSHDSNVAQHGSPIASENRTSGTDPERAVGSKDSEFGGLKKKANKRKKTGRAMMKADPSNSKNALVGENGSVQKNVEEKENEEENFKPHSATKPKSSAASSKVEVFGVADESSPVCHEEIAGKSVGKPNNKTVKTNEKFHKVDYNRQQPQKVLSRLKNEPLCFILSGHRLQRKEFLQVIRRLKGKFCRDSHQWSYQATHFIAPDPIRRTEKFFAAAASGRWILMSDYLSSCNQAGKFLPEEPYEWHKNGLSEDGAINLEAPRKWRQLQERTGHGAFYGMRIIVYGECIAPPLDTLKRAVKAGDGDILATSPPYTRFLKSGVDFAVVSPGMPRVDMWVREFLKHEVPCVVADYLVEYVCKPGYSLDRHVLYNTHEWAEKSFSNLTSRAEEIVEGLTPEESPNDTEDNDITCQVCGSGDRGEVMLICGDENGSVGCGVGIHIDCCDPPLEAIPEEDWFCPKCSRSSSINNTKSSKKRVSNPSLLSSFERVEIVESF
ncbi:hypothetical protein V6N13_128350 [Hibiscus sabdariffa]|uniref:BRCT domain-containing protein n=1 Tax=Hibiscus sabdariffa TaxID=183260 RepID=A0ABR2P173_9ROSI